MRKPARSSNAPDFHCHSTFSTLDGLGSPEAVVLRAKELGWGAASLTEHGGMSSAIPFYQACRANKINPILGMEAYVVPHHVLGVKDKDTRSRSFHLTLLALSKEGYQNLVAWSSFSMRPENFYYKPRISVDAMIEIAPWPLHHNVILSGCFVAGTDVWTASGELLPIEEIEKGMEVLNRYGESDAVKSPTLRYWDGEMCKVRAMRYGIDINCTSDHQFLVLEGRRTSRRVHAGTAMRSVGAPVAKPGTPQNRAETFLSTPTYKAAEELTQYDWLLMPVADTSQEGQWDGVVLKRNPDRRGSDVVFEASLENAEMLGWFLAEGAASTTGGAKNTRLTFSLGKTEAAEAEQIASTLRAMGLKPKITDRSHRGSIEIACCSTPLAEWLAAECGKGSGNKKLPSFVWQMSEQEKFSLLRGMLHGDGYVQTRPRTETSPAKNRMVWASISKSLAVGLYQLLISLGMRPSLDISKPRGIHKKAYYVNVSGKQLEVLVRLLDGEYVTREDFLEINASYFYEHEGALYLPHRVSAVSVEEVHRLPVHCMKVEDDPSFLAEGFVVHNCLGSEICQCLLNMNGTALQAGVAYTEAMKEAFPNFYIEIQNHGRKKFMEMDLPNYHEMVEREGIAREKLLQIAELTKTPIVITNDSHYQRPEQRKAHIAMLASKMSKGRQGESHHAAQESNQISSYTKEYGYWQNFQQPLEPIAERTLSPRQAKEAIDNVNAIAAEADIRLDFLDSFSYSIPASGFNDPLVAIRKRSRERLAGLIQQHGEAAQARFDREMEAMGDFANYLLLMSDFIIAAREQGILTSTRGSAGSSLVCYCLYIHDIDPLHYKLAFERFVNPARKKFPDIDIDIEASRHGDFMRNVQEHMEKLEGKGQVVPICTFGTLANRATFRMVTESMGMSKEQRDEVSKLLPQMIDSGMVTEENDVYETLKEEYPELYEISSSIFDSVRNLSQHACGYLFGTKDRPLKDWIPMALIASSGATVTQYNMKMLEDMGWVKGDFLRLDTLKIIKRTMQMAGIDGELKDIPIDDEATFDLLCSGKTEGVHSMQGKTQRQGCIEVQPRTIHDLVVIQALYRPSGTRTGFAKMLVKRRRSEEDWEVPALVADILDPTYGLPIYQDQVLQICYRVGMPDIEVDNVLKAIKMSKGVGRGAKEAFEKVSPVFHQYAKEHMESAERKALWDLVDAFQGYGFAKAHATAYALLACKMAYLKAHFPQEFFSALLDVYPGEARYLAAAKGEGFSFLPPDVNVSAGGFTKGEDKTSIRVGLSRVRGVGPRAVDEIVRGQPFSSLDDFKSRTDGRAIKQNTVEALASCGALDSLGIRATATDAEQLTLLEMTLEEPKAFKGVKLNKKLYKPRNGNWRYSGLIHSVDKTEGKQFVSKLFWVPDLPEKDIYQKKASPWALAKTNLLMVVDENGIPFELMANEDKAHNTMLLNFLASRCQGGVLAAEGQVKLPFDKGHPLGFSFWGITGSEQEAPEVWHLPEKFKKVFVELHRRKRQTYQKG